MDYQKKYLEILSKEFPTVQQLTTELINLTAILNLPKGTEIFITDIHGEYDAFNHYLKNASGIIKEKIDLIFPKLSEKDKNRLAFFIYYPTDMLKKYQKDLDYLTLKKIILSRMIQLSRHIATKYTKSKVQKTLTKEFSYIIQELIYETEDHEDKERYYEAIINAIFETKRENKFILQISRFIRSLAIDRLHIVGDIFDRGPKPHLVMEKLMTKSNVDIQWGNHDINFLGAASGSEVMVANVIRIAARYNNLDSFEDGYGINLLPLARFASKYYANDPCTSFLPKNTKFNVSLDEDLNFVAKIHKAISLIQFKLENEVIIRNPDFQLQDRCLLHQVNPLTHTIHMGEAEVPLSDSSFPTVDFSNPYELTFEEQEVIDHLTQLFLHNEMLQKHARYLFQTGSMYSKYNNNLLFHAAIPLNEGGSFMSQLVDGSPYCGKALLDIYEKKIRHAFLNRYEKENFDKDYFMMLWQGKSSPLFGKNAMKTFERYFIQDKKYHEEQKNPYFSLRIQEPILKQIYQEFDLDFNHSKIVNGHFPVDITKGEKVILANHRIYNIDGGMSKEYVSQTSMGGYSLISDSHAYFLVSHERFESYMELIQNEQDIITVMRDEELNNRRTYIYDTNKGAELKEQIADLYQLLHAYRDGSIKEKA